MVERSTSELCTGVFYVLYYCGKSFFAENSCVVSLSSRYFPQVYVPFLFQKGSELFKNFDHGFGQQLVPLISCLIMNNRALITTSCTGKDIVGKHRCYECHQLKALFHFSCSQPFQRGDMHTISSNLTLIDPNGT